MNQYAKNLIQIYILLILILANNNIFAKEDNVHYIIEKKKINKKSCFDSSYNYYYNENIIKWNDIRKILLAINNNSTTNLVNKGDFWSGFSYTSGMLFAPAFLITVISLFDYKNNGKFEKGVYITTGSLLSTSLITGFISNNYYEKAIDVYNKSILNELKDKINNYNMNPKEYQISLNIKYYFNF